jgi:general secretion pathway protein M
MATDARDLPKDDAAGRGALDAAMSAPRGVDKSAATAPASGPRSAWARLGSRERRMVTWVGALVAALLLWTVAIRPALTVTQETSRRLPQLDAQLTEMQRLAAESRELRGVPRLQPAQASAALKSSTDALGAAGKLTLAGERATLTLTNATGEQVQRWLVDARSAARARTIEAKLTRVAAGYSGTIVVALPATN